MDLAVHEMISFNEKNSFDIKIDLESHNFGCLLRKCTENIFYTIVVIGLEPKIWSCKMGQSMQLK